MSTRSVVVYVGDKNNTKFYTRKYVLQLQTVMKDMGVDLRQGYEASGKRS